jgi:hypothetical protein
MPLGSAAELPHGVQEWQVRFRFPIVLSALPTPDPHRAPCGQAGQPQVKHRRLADPLATDETAGGRLYRRAGTTLRAVTSLASHGGS